MAQQKPDPLDHADQAFIIERAGFLALEAIRDPVHAATAAELEEYRNSE
jgi:hypothetical protein